MSETLLYETAPTTPRGAEKLARLHGFADVSELAQGLPSNASVLDVGAGDSPLGSGVAALRPDITWTNFDLSYSDSVAVERLRQSAPDNVRFVTGDVTKIEERYEPETFDAVFSYWLWPHLSLGYAEDEEPTLAVQAAESVYNLAREGGMISIGPEVGKVSLKEQPAYRTTKDTITSAADFASTVVEKTRLHGLARVAQRTTNSTVIPYFGTSRFIRKGDGARAVEIVEPASGEFIPLMSYKGARTVVNLADEVARFATTDKESKQYLGSRLKVAAIVGGSLAVAAAVQKVRRSHR